jgi:hypothetical protein
MNFGTIKVRQEEADLFAEFSAPPMNLLGPELARDLVSLIQQAEADHTFKILVFKSADRDWRVGWSDRTSSLHSGEPRPYHPNQFDTAGNDSIKQQIITHGVIPQLLCNIRPRRSHMRIVGEQFVLLLKQIDESVRRDGVVLGDEIPNLHQVLLGKWCNSNARHLPCPALVSLLAISLKALPATLLDRGDVEILARSTLDALIPKPPNFTDRIGSRSASRLPLAQGFSDNLAA